MSKQIKTEMHCHTHFSGDGFITPLQLERRCRKRNIDCICLTDHNTMQGVWEFSDKVNIRIIAGQEISTGQGDLTGLFLKDEVESGLGLQRTIEAIRTQKGVVYLPHPFDKFRKSSVKSADAERISENIDVIEIFNSRTFDAECNTMALEFARANDIVIAVGSDAHHQFEIGNAYMLMDDFDGPESFLASVKKATYVTRKCSFGLRLYIKALKLLTGKD